MAEPKKDEKPPVDPAVNQLDQKPAEKQDEKPKETVKSETPEKQEKKAGMKYYRSTIAGLGFQVSESDPENPVAPEVVRFTPYFERFQGDRVRVGYLQTADAKLQKRLADDPNVEEISASDHKKATGDKAELAS